MVTLSLYKDVHLKLISPMMIGFKSHQNSISKIRSRASVASQRATLYVENRKRNRVEIFEKCYPAVLLRTHCRVSIIDIYKRRFLLRCLFHFASFVFISRLSGRDSCCMDELFKLREHISGDVAIINQYLARRQRCCCCLRLISECSAREEPGCHGQSEGSFFLNVTPCSFLRFI